VTDATNIQVKISKNSRNILTGLWKVYGTKKSKFVNQNCKLGQGLFNSMFSHAPEMHLPTSQGEYSHCGPVTKYTQRNSEGY